MRTKSTKIWIWVFGQSEVWDAAIFHTDWRIYISSHPCFTGTYGKRSWKRAWKQGGVEPREEGGEAREWLNIPSRRGGGYMVLPHLQECDPVIERSSLCWGLNSLYIFRMYWIRGGPAWSTLSCASVKQQTVLLSPHWIRCRVIMMADLIKGQNQTEVRGVCSSVWVLHRCFVPGDEERFGKTAESMKLLNSPPWPSIWECAGRSWLD